MIGRIFGALCFALIGGALGGAIAIGIMFAIAVIGR